MIGLPDLFRFTDVITKLAAFAKPCYTNNVSDEVTETPSQPKMVMCTKLKMELPAMIYRPFQGALGDRIYDTISQDAWNSWIEHSKMLVNEYRLDLSSEKAHDMLKEQCEEFLFSDGETKAPPDFVSEPAR